VQHDRALEALIENLREAEVGEARRLADRVSRSRREHHVFGLHVPVNQPARVRLGEGAEHLDRPGRGDVGRDGTGRHSLVESAPEHGLAHEVPLAVGGLARVEDPHRERRRQRRRGPRFAGEARPDRDVDAVSLREARERDLRVREPVIRQVDLLHRSATEQAHHRVATGVEGA
jgi:hypothetical protein